MKACNRTRGLFLGLLISLLAVFPAQAAPTNLMAAKQLVDTLGRNALASLQSPQLTPADREAAFTLVLQQGFAVDLIGRFVLGRHWKTATAAERADYRTLFRGFMVKSYTGYLSGLEGTSFEITQAIPIGEQDILVTTRIDRAAGTAVEAGWRVRAIEGSHKIIDVVVEGVSMAATQRQEFSSVVKSRGVGGLLAILRSRVQTLTASR